MNKLWTAFLKPRGWVAKWLLGLSLVAFLSLGFLGYLTPLKTFLDSDALAFSVGEVRFSAYMLLKGLLTVIAAFWLAGIFSEFGEVRIRRLEALKASNRALLTKAFQILVYFVALLIGLDVLNINLTGLAVFSGAVGIGLGFGLQKVTSNFISGIILLFEKTVEEGDLVELDAATVGFVRHTGARYTLVETFEGREIMIPNEDFITNRVTNWTYSNSQGRIDIHIGISYSCDRERAFDLMLEAANEHPRCSKEPQAECYLVDYGESSVNFTLYFWVDNIIDGRKRPRSDVLFAIGRKFKENNIEIPFPQRDLHIKQGEIPQ